MNFSKRYEKLSQRVAFRIKTDKCKSSKISMFKFQNFPRINEIIEQNDEYTSKILKSYL